jgi:hypothetical protein
MPQRNEFECATIAEMVHDCFSEETNTAFEAEAIVVKEVFEVEGGWSVPSHAYVFHIHVSVLSVSPLKTRLLTLSSYHCLRLSIDLKRNSINLCL